MRNTDVVTVRGLREAYGDRVIVDDLDLDVPADEIVGLIGANGAGKTTTVECLQGLRKPDAGTLRVNHVFAKLGLRDRAAAVIFALDHNLSGRTG